MIEHAKYFLNCRSGLIETCIKCCERTESEIGRMREGSSMGPREGTLKSQKARRQWQRQARAGGLRTRAW